MKRIFVSLLFLMLMFCFCSCSATPAPKKGTEKPTQMELQTSISNVKEPTFPETEIEIANGIREFSYDNAIKMWENDPGVYYDGFVNITKRETTTKEQAIDLAKKEVTLIYNEILVSYDKQAKMWAVTFCMKDTLGGCQTVYLDENGVTQLIVYGE